MDYGNLAEYEKERALNTKMHLDLIIFHGKLDENLLKGRVLDWGAGFGTNTQALNNFGRYVEAVDISDCVDEISKKGILPKERVYKTDGIKFLKERPNTYDIITSFFIGPLEGRKGKQFLREFHESACIGLKPEGRMLITSDLGSFQ